jgi:hypothetical protein
VSIAAIQVPPGVADSMVESLRLGVVPLRELIQSVDYGGRPPRTRGY